MATINPIDAAIGTIEAFLTTEMAPVAELIDPDNMIVSPAVAVANPAIKAAVDASAAEAYEEFAKLFSKDCTSIEDLVDKCLMPSIKMLVPGADDDPAVAVKRQAKRDALVTAFKNTVIEAKMSTLNDGRVEKYACLNAIGGKCTDALAALQAIKTQLDTMARELQEANEKADEFETERDTALDEAKARKAELKGAEAEIERLQQENLRIEGLHTGTEVQLEQVRKEVAAAKAAQTAAEQALVLAQQEVERARKETADAKLEAERVKKAAEDIAAGKGKAVADDLSDRLAALEDFRAESKRCLLAWTKLTQTLDKKLSPLKEIKLGEPVVAKPPVSPELEKKLNAYLLVHPFPVFSPTDDMAVIGASVNTWVADLPRDEIGAAAFDYFKGTQPIMTGVDRPVEFKSYAPYMVPLTLDFTAHVPSPGAGVGTSGGRVVGGAGVAGTGPSTSTSSSSSTSTSSSSSASSADPATVPPPSAPGATPSSAPSVSVVAPPTTTTSSTAGAVVVDPTMSMSGSLLSSVIVTPSGSASSTTSAPSDSYITPPVEDVDDNVYFEERRDTYIKLGMPALRSYFVNDARYLNSRGARYLAGVLTKVDHAQGVEKDAPVRLVTGQKIKL